MQTVEKQGTALATLHQIEQELQQEFLERDVAIRAALVALVARSHLVLLGPPGTGKSALVNAISERFCDGNGQGLENFVYLLTRFTTPEELFGPVSVHGLKNDTYERVTHGKLPRAQVAFLDEIFKSSSAVLNVLLTILNERVFDNGTKRVGVPLITLFGASNEMPQEASDLEALWDRFLVRLQVGYLSDGNFEKLLASQNASTKSRTFISQQDLEQLQKAAEAMPIPGSITQTLVKLRRELKQEKGIESSDRRWVQCLRILQAHALLENRSAVEEDDLAILAHCLWSQPQDIPEIDKRVSKLVNPLYVKASELKDMAMSIRKKAQEDMVAHQGTDEKDAMERSRIAFDGLNKVKKVIKELKELFDTAQSQAMKTRRIEEAVAEAELVKKDMVESGDFY